MRVLVDALPLRRGGGVQFLRHQLTAFAQISPELEVLVLRSPWTELGEVPAPVQTVRLRSVAQRFAYEQVVLPWRRSDVLYCAANFGPLVRRSPMILTVHSPNYYGEALGMGDAAPSRPPWKVRANHLAIQRADVVVAVSHSLAQSVAETVPSARAKLQVVPLGAPTWPEASIAVPGLPERFILSVASAAPHKRVVDVVAGWAQLQVRTTDLALVLVGAHSEGQEKEYRRVAGAASDRLFLLGPIGDRRRIKWLYENASALVSMTILETFHLPVVEAGSLGCPLIVTDIPVHREVAGGHATYVAPRDVAALTATLAEQDHELAPRSRPWQWPWSWEDNARSYTTLFKSMTAARGS